MCNVDVIASLRSGFYGLATTVVVMILSNTDTVMKRSSKPKFGVGLDRGVLVQHIDFLLLGIPLVRHWSSPESAEPELCKLYFDFNILVAGLPRLCVCICRVYW